MASYSEYIEKIKQEGFRPCVIGAMVCSGLIGLSKSNKYPGYEFLQGGINYGETPIEAIERETIEELGFWFHKECNFPPKRHQFLFEDRMEMKVKEPVISDKGPIKTKGKHYLIYALEINPENEKLPQINPDDFEFRGTTVKFHEHKWVTKAEALKLIEQITNPKKMEIAKRTIGILAELGYCSHDLDL